MSRVLDRLKDPFYAQLLFHVEGTIYVHDRQAEQAGITLSDSHVKSALTKAYKLFLGESPEIPEKSARDQHLAALISDLLELPKNVLGTFANEREETVEGQIPRQIWANAIETTLASLNGRMSPAPGMRAYLDYLGEFLAEASEQINSEEAQQRKRP